MKKGLYQHFKGNQYLVLGTAIHTETNEELVLYREAKGQQNFVRPKAMFEALVSKETPRFKFLKNTE